jgi:hypothetical protein
LNRCFLTTQDGPIMGRESTSDSINATLDVDCVDKEEESYSWSAPFMTAHFFEKYEPYMVIRYSLWIRLIIFSLGFPLAILFEEISGFCYTIPWDEYVNHTIYLWFSSDTVPPSPELRYQSSHSIVLSEVPRTTPPSSYLLWFSCFLVVTFICCVSISEIPQMSP